MNKTGLYDHACGVVNFFESKAFKSSNLGEPDIVFQLADATNEYFATDDGKADLTAFFKRKINRSDMEESLIEYTVEQFNRLIEDGYKLECM